jgi:hypothetical protein
VSRYDFALLICDVLGYDKSLVVKEINGHGEKVQRPWLPYNLSLNAAELADKIPLRDRLVQMGRGSLTY